MPLAAVMLRVEVGAETEASGFQSRFEHRLAPTLFALSRPGANRRSQARVLPEKRDALVSAPLQMPRRLRAARPIVKRNRVGLRCRFARVNEVNLRDIRPICLAARRVAARRVAARRVAARRVAA